MVKHLPPEDQLIWENFTKDIRPLKNDKVKPSLKNVYSTFKSQASRQEIKVNCFQKVDQLHPNDLRHISINGQLDLHGFTQDIGELELREFLRNAVYKKWKWVCIITGKGSLKRPSILREQTPKWLQKMPEFVTGYAQAKPEDGGAGAFYVKIRQRNKK